MSQESSLVLNAPFRDKEAQVYKLLLLAVESLSEVKESPNDLCRLALLRNFFEKRKDSFCQSNEFLYKLFLLEDLCKSINRALSQSDSGISDVIKLDDFFKCFDSFTNVIII